MSRLQSLTWRFENIDRDRCQDGYLGPLMRYGVCGIQRIYTSAGKSRASHGRRDQPPSHYRCSGHGWVWSIAHVSAHGGIYTAAIECGTHDGRSAGGAQHPIPTLPTLWLRRVYIASLGRETQWRKTSANRHSSSAERSDHQSDHQLTPFAIASRPFFTALVNSL